MVILLVMLALSGFAILVAGSMTSSLQVSDFGSAFLMAAAMVAAGWLLSMPIHMAEGALMAWLTGSAEPPTRPTGWWLYSRYLFAGFTFAQNFVLFYIVGLLMPGITIRGLLGPLVAITLMTLIDVLVPQALVSAAGGFLSDWDDHGANAAALLYSSVMQGSERNRGPRQGTGVR
jgi:hypothetical protein